MPLPLKAAHPIYANARWLRMCSSSLQLATPSRPRNASATSSTTLRLGRPTRDHNSNCHFRQIFPLQTGSIFGAVRRRDPAPSEETTGSAKRSRQLEDPQSVTESLTTGGSPRCNSPGLPSWCKCYCRSVPSKRNIGRDHQGQNSGTSQWKMFRFANRHS